MSKERLLAKLRPFGQEHLLTFWEQLTDEERCSLVSQIEKIDFDLLGQLYHGHARNQRTELIALLERAGPPPAICLQNTEQNPFSLETARKKGQDAIAQGRIAAVLVAGGQATRLGFPQPKGMYPIGPLSGKTLFQIHFEKVIATAQRYKGRIPLCLMTSPATHQPTVEFLVEHKRFGLREEDLLIFCQSTMPALDAESGRVLLESPSQIALSPDGHGGLPAAMLQSGVFAELERRGIEHVFYFQVDNPLATICDPAFIGYHLLAGAEFSLQVVAKREPLERLGNVMQLAGHIQIVEYSDLPDEVVHLRNADGTLRYWAGSIAVHVISLELLRRGAASAAGLPFHIARKKVSHVDAVGRRCEPERPNALKFERFVFDLLHLTEKVLVVEVDREEAFAPLKNAPGSGEDSPETVQAQMAALYRRWLRKVGAEVAEETLVEISPLWALDAEELSAKIPPGMYINQPLYLG